MTTRGPTASLAFALAVTCGCARDVEREKGRSQASEPPALGSSPSTRPSGAPPAPASVCSAPAPAMLELERELVERVNELRRSGGGCDAQRGRNTSSALPRLVSSPPLACAARLNSEDMAQTGHFAHRNLEQRGPLQRSRLAGYSGKAVLENLAWGQLTASEVTSAWLASREHCQALFSPVVDEIGAGVAIGPGSKRFWTLLLGTK